MPTGVPGCGILCQARPVGLFEVGEEFPFQPIAAAAQEPAEGAVGERAAVHRLEAPPGDSCTASRGWLSTAAPEAGSKDSGWNSPRHGAEVPVAASNGPSSRKRATRLAVVCEGRQKLPACMHTWRLLWRRKWSPRGPWWRSAANSACQSGSPGRLSRKRWLIRQRRCAPPTQGSRRVSKTRAKWKSPRPSQQPWRRAWSSRSRLHRSNSWPRVRALEMAQRSTFFAAHRLPAVSSTQASPGSAMRKLLS